MAKSSQAVSGLNLHTDKPTTLTFKQLYNWVIWQVPKPINNALSGAVKPPSAESKWYPAIIQVKDKKVQVFANLDQLFDSPEDASKFLDKNHQQTS